MGISITSTTKLRPHADTPTEVDGRDEIPTYRLTLGQRSPVGVPTIIIKGATLG